MIELRDINKTFLNSGIQKSILKDIKSSFNKGTFNCIVGSSGAGKSTLLRIISGLDNNHEGTVLIDDLLVNDYLKQNKISFVFQKYASFEWLTVKENVSLGCTSEDVSERVDLMLKKVGLSEVSELYPSQLSGGMQQRVAIARTFLQDSEVILFDEPFGALDAQTRESMQNLLLDLWENQKKTILFVTHDLDEAVLLADKVIVMGTNPGTIEASLNIDLPRPRKKDIQFTPNFVKFKKSLIYSIRTESIKGQLRVGSFKKNKMEGHIRLGLLIWSGNAPWYIASEKLLFKKHEIDVSLVSKDSVEDLLLLLSNNEIDVFSTTLDVALEFTSKNPGFKISHPLSLSKGADAIIVKTEYSSIEDLLGKKIGVEKGGPADFFLDYILSTLGYSRDDFQIEHLLGPEIGASLIRDEIQGAVLWEPWLSRAVELSGAKVIHSTKHKKNQVLYDVLITRTDFVDTHGVEIKKLFNVWSETNDLLDNETIPADLAESVGISVTDLAMVLEKISFISEEPKDFKNKMKQVQKALQKAGRISEIENVDALII